jgi:hypothetical protein
MNNYSCLDYWYFFWNDFCKEVQITGQQFIALFNEDEQPNHRYSPVPQNIIEQKVIKKIPVTPKEIVIDIEKLLNSDTKPQTILTHKTESNTKLQNILTHNSDSNNKMQDVVTHNVVTHNVVTHKTLEEKATIQDFKDFILISQYEDEFEVLDIV